MITTDMRRLIEEQRLGLVATVDADGTPNLSPKGTMLVVDSRTIAFSVIRSPGTARNLAVRAGMEICFTDPFARIGYRFKGEAIDHMPGSPGHNDLLPHFEALWPSLTHRMRSLVALTVTRALLVRTPPYDTGTTEVELRQHWTNHYRSIQPGGDFMTKSEGWKA